MSNVWIWSDTYISHEAVINYENRPFYREGFFICSICEGQDVYGTSEDRPEKYKKKLEEKEN